MKTIGQFLLRGLQPNRRQHWLTFGRWVMVVLYIGLIAFLTLSPAKHVSSLSLPLPHFDKLAHAAMHGLLALMICWALRYRFRQRLWLLYVVVIAHFYGFLMEAGQYYMPYGRTFSWGDIAANTGGALIAVSLLGIHRSWKERIMAAGTTESKAETLIGKRLFDIVIASLGLFLLSPLLLLLTLLVRLNHGSPVLFRQLRPGLDGNPFVIYKFRTMIEACDSNGEPLPDHQRLTLLGRLLRAASLDELPELINVLKGEMSLVGPRPLLLRYLPRYTPQQARRHHLRPGITGWAQVKGRNAISWEEKFKLDVWYVDNHSFRLDLKILAMTVWQVLARRDINAGRQVTMPEFMGTEAEPKDGHPDRQAISS